MGWVKLLLLVLTVLAPICGVLINEILKQKVPSGFSEPNDLQYSLAWESVKKTVAHFLIQVGLISKLKYLRTVRDTDRFLPKENKNCKVTEKKVAGIRVRIYSPRVAFKNGPMVFYIHGGGWVYGSISRSDALMHYMAPRLGAVMVSIGYKRAPKFKFPKPVEDCVKVVKYFMKNPQEFDVDKTQFGLVGEGAGGNIATAAALKLGQEPTLPKLQCLLLLHPAMQAVNFHTASYWQFQDFPLLSKKDMAEFWLYYGLGNIEYTPSLLTNDHISESAKKTYEIVFDKNVFPSFFVHADYEPAQTIGGNETMWKEIKHVFESELFMPMFSKNLEVLPSTFIYTAAQDVLRDDAVLFYIQLRKAGVDVSHFLHREGFHGILDYVEKYKEADTACLQIIQFLKSKLLHDRITKNMQEFIHPDHD